MQNTLTRYEETLLVCKEIFLNKNADYGLSWTIMRTPSLTDQIYIKAKRIREIEGGKEQKISDPIEEELRGIINYSIMAIIQLSNECDEHSELQIVEKLYNAITEDAKNLMLRKNNDYGEAWKDMRPSSFTDLIMAKLLRIKQIEDNEGKTKVSEGIQSNYLDIINYAIFALIIRQKKSD